MIGTPSAMWPSVPDPHLFDPEVVAAARSLVGAERRSPLAYWLMGSAVGMGLTGYRHGPAAQSPTWVDPVLDLVALVYLAVAASYFGAVHLKRATSRRWLVSLLVVTRRQDRVPADMSIVQWAKALVAAVEESATEDRG